MFTQNRRNLPVEFAERLSEVVRHFVVGSHGKAGAVVCKIQAPPGRSGEVIKVSTFDAHQELASGRVFAINSPVPIQRAMQLNKPGPAPPIKPLREPMPDVSVARAEAVHSSYPGADECLRCQVVVVERDDRRAFSAE